MIDCQCLCVGKSHLTFYIQIWVLNLILTQHLIFAGKYCEFHQVYREGDLKKAAGLLVSLLASKISPK